MTVTRRRLRVTGTVQGVGYRPFVYRHAIDLGLTGWVRNDSAGVLIDVEGEASVIDALQRVLVEQAPPLARVTSVTSEVVDSASDHGAHTGFAIVESDAAGAPSAPVSIDTATCDDCLAEVLDPNDRRHRYPFTNCTNCGPRYTIVLRVPYDRPATTMAGFAMCPECLAEYHDPGNRRFHAQPNACPVCGPQLRWHDLASGLRATRDEALAEAAAALRSGKVIGVKGIGGYHLAVDATDSQAVAELRRRKARDDKPFAVMVGDLAAAEAVIELDDEVSSALSSPRRPIVLARRRAGRDRRRRRRSGVARARADAALQPVAPSAARGRRPSAGHDERQPQRRAHRPRGRRRDDAARTARRRVAVARPCDPHPLRRLGRSGLWTSTPAAAPLSRLRAGTVAASLRAQPSGPRPRSRAEEHDRRHEGFDGRAEPSSRRPRAPRHVHLVSPSG